MNELTSQRFNVVKGPLFQNEGRCSAFDMEIIFTRKVVHLASF